MPGPQVYTATPKDGGEPFDFEWSGSAPPTEADVDEIIAASGEKNLHWGR